LTMKAGAQDFFSKWQLARLGSAIERELQEASFRREGRRVHAELQRTQASFRMMVESIRDSAIFMLDADGKVASWNGGAERMTGWREADIVGQPVAVLYTDEDRAAGRPAAQLRDAGRDGSHRSEGWRVRRDGSRFWAEESVDSIVEDHHPIGFVQVVRDVSERQKLLNELRLAVRARDQFLTIASHELKTPLTALQLQIQVLQRTLARGQFDPPILASKLEIVGRSSQKLAELIENLLDVTRITAGRMELRLTEVDLVEVVQAVLSAQRAVIERSGSTVTVDAPKSLVGRFDRMRMEMVVANLLGNAVKYGGGHPIEVHLAERGGRAELRVCDHGIGIPPAEQARIFERFERAVPARHYGGFGLGLWIVRQIVEAHGGRIRVESAPGAGSRFIVELQLS
jgi:PAS domain S-box-containing protein